MGRVLSNNTALQYSIENTENVPGDIGLLQGSPVWKSLEPNSYGTIGATISTVARNPISKNRQRRKGTITDLDSVAEFEADLTVSHFKDFAEGFMFALFDGVEEFAPSATDTNSYTVATGSVLVAGTLVYARGFGIAGNNGLKEVAAAATSTDIPVTTALVAEVTPPTNSEVMVCGVRTPAGDLGINVTGTVITISSASGIFDDAGLNLVPGMGIFIGGSAALNQFSTGANVGYARIVSIAAAGASIVIDKTSAVFVTEAAAIQEVDIYFGQFLRNVATDDALFLERSFQFELAYPNLTNPSGDQYEYSIGNYCNTLAFTLPLTDKATISPTFIGTDTEALTPTRKTNAATPVSPNKTSSFNTTQDCARLRIAAVDETGLTTDFKSLTLNLNNGVSPEKVLCNLGSRFMNYGNLEINLEAQILFTDIAVTEAIRNNTSVSMDFVVKNDDGAIHIDIPSMTLGGGGKDFPVNESVLLNLTCDSYADPVLDTSIGITIYPFIPTL